MKQGLHEREPAPRERAADTAAGNEPSEPAPADPILSARLRRLLAPRPAPPPAPSAPPARDPYGYD